MKKKELQMKGGNFMWREKDTCPIWLPTDGATDSVLNQFRPTSAGCFLSETNSAVDFPKR